jgi:1,4-dihydroxy-2-naphthoyl-CoA hydrolase
MTRDLTRADLQGPGELMRLLEIDFEEIGRPRASPAWSPPTSATISRGLVHGGLYTAVIETFATTGAFEAVKNRSQQAVGVSNATDFLRPHRTGRLQVVAVPDPTGTNPTALAGRDRPPRRRQADRARPGAPAEHRRDARSLTTLPQRR